MNAFVCALRVDGSPISQTELFASLVKLPRPRELATSIAGAFAMVATANPAMRPLTASINGLSGAGDVRLDNREDIAAIAKIDARGSNDLEIVLAALSQEREAVIPRLLGDFSFVAWDARAQKVIAARDAFGVKPLFYRRTGQLLLLSSRLEPLCGDEQLDRVFIADFLKGQSRPGPRTIWQGTLQLEPGALLVQRGSVTVQSRYWDARTFEPHATISEDRAVESFRELFFDAVHKRVAAGETWAQLSGGLDSSAVVSAAEWLREQRGAHGVAGTVTVADSLGNGDECRFSNLVLARYGLRNELLRDYWPWRNDHGDPPRATDEPSALFPFHARDQRMVDLVVQSGGRVLLSGLGSDHYMYGSLTYLADMFARGSLRAGAREVFQWATTTRRSVWHTARVNVLNPILHNIRDPSMRLGTMFNTQTALELARVTNWVQRGAFQDQIEVRYPFLSRPLVEFTLQLPVAMKIRPQGRKWVLREALRGVLPEEVRTRIQKGGIDARILWALQHERARVDALIKDPILAQLGCVDAAEVRRTVDAARNGLAKDTFSVLTVLGLESWLRARHDAWPREFAAQTAA